MVYFGEFREKIDRQGRIVIPAKLRSQFKEVSDKQKVSLFITKGLENCLFIFSQEVWEKQNVRLKDLPFTKEDPRTFTRLFFSGASQSNIDKQGRILVPVNLLQYAYIKENIVLIGAGTRIEIWDEDRWDKYYADSLKMYERISEQLMEHQT